MARNSMNPYSEFTCLYTNQKQKKTKTWQDGHLRFFHNNSKVVLYDVKFNSLDSTFHRGATIAVGDDMDMDKHLITVEDLTEAYATSSVDQRTNAASASIVRRIAPIIKTPTATSTPKFIPTQAEISVNEPTSVSSRKNQDSAQQPLNDNLSIAMSSNQSVAKRKKWRPPIPTVASNPTIQDTSNKDQGWDAFDQFELQEMLSDSIVELLEPAVGASNPKAGDNIPKSTVLTATTNPKPAPKRRKVGLSRVSSAPGTTTGQSSLVTSHRPPSSQLEFPNAARCTNFTGKNQSQLLRRSMSLGCRFMSSSQYKDGMTFLIYEHLQIMVIEIAIAMWSIKANPSTQEGTTLDAMYRSRGIHMHSDSTLRRRGDAYPGFPLYSDKAFNSGGTAGTTAATIQAVSQQGVSLSTSNKEHHSKYSKDDLWVISTTSRFDAVSTFFARSVFYGPSGNDIELQCLSTKDSNIARDMLKHCTKVCAIRLLNAMSEFMMLDNLSESLTQTPLLPVLLNYVPPELVKASKTSVFKAPSRVPEKSGCVVLTEEDGIDVEREICDTVSQYQLNEGQATVLRTFARTVIRGPGWTQTSEDSTPVILVHGVFGAGKSFLIAVLIVFIDNIINKSRLLTREKRSCRFLVSSMTNVAVDRILMALLDLNYTNFVRVGSLKKVARRVLPYTAQSNTSRTGEDIKELQSILDDDSLSITERQYVKIAMKKFQKLENRGIVESANVVGATCIASTFEVLDDVTFPIVILDEASQLLEPMSLIPICRAAAEKLVMVGDPLQLSPPLNTNDDGSSKGLSRTLFDRSSEMGFKPIMLRTQYRCHRRIADISNTLFYSNVLQTGVNLEDRAPLIEGLPTLTFIDNVGQEIQNTRTKSFTNPAEIRLIVTFIQRLLNLNIPETSIGVISLYKSQADGIQAELSEQLKNSGLKGSVQISTVDAFQGSEKDIIIVSTVRTDSIGFIDNRQRVNVALTRSKRLVLPEQALAIPVGSMHSSFTDLKIPYPSHLFIIGASQLLNFNSIWGSIIRDHCGGSTDGVMKADQFVQLLRTLKPLPKQVVSNQALLVASEDEDEDYDEEHEDEDGDSYYQGDEDLGYDEDGASQEQFASGSVALEAPSGTYALYETDEDDSEDSHDGRGGGRQQRFRGQSSYRDEIYPNPAKHNSPAEYIKSCNSGFEARPNAMDDVTTGTDYHNKAYGTIANIQSDGSTQSGKNIKTSVQFVAHEQDDSFAQVQMPEPRFLEQEHLSSLKGLSQFEDTLDGELEVEIPSKTSLLKVDSQISVKKEQEPAVAPEEVDKVIWEMDDEPEDIEEDKDYNVDVTAGASNMNGLLAHQQQQQQQYISHADTVNPEYSDVLSSIDNSSQRARERSSVAATYESQRIEDLDVANFSQLVASNGQSVTTETPLTQNIARNVETGPPQTSLEDDEEDDDMSCLEVGDLDMI